MPRAYSAPATAGCASPPTRPGCRTAALPTTCNPSTAAPTRRAFLARRGHALENRRRPRFGRLRAWRATRRTGFDTIIREGGKRFRYAFLYGAQAATAGRIIYDIARAAQADRQHATACCSNCSAIPHARMKPLIKQIGGRARRKFIDRDARSANGSCEHLESHAGKHGWLPGLDGRRVPVRALYTALNYIVTSSEAIICKRWLVCSLRRAPRPLSLRLGRRRRHRAVDSR